jgi:hypothetical protein
MKWQCGCSDIYGPCNFHGPKPLDWLWSTMFYITIFSFLLCQTSSADDPYFAQKNHVLPQDSWVFSPDKTKEVRNKLIDGETYFKLNESLSKSIELYKNNEEIQQNKVNLLLEQNDKLAQRLASSQSLNNWERFGLFFLGIAATVGAGWAISRAR